MSIPNVLSIAGSDPSGGAGIQADLKTFAALGAYGMSAITAITVQNTRGVAGVHFVPTAMVAGEIDAVFADIRVDAVKLGMLGTVDIVNTVADALARHEVRTLVLDPVMVATSGHSLLDTGAIAAVRERLVPRALVLTPNLPEAGALLDAPAPTTLAEMRDAARALHGLGPRYVLLKGGHLDDETSPDVLFDGARMLELPAARVATANTHGTGCTLSSAIAALLPQCDDVVEVMRRAKAYVTAAIATSGALSVGSGHGPVHHFHALWGGAYDGASMRRASLEVS